MILIIRITVVFIISVCAALVNAEESLHWTEKDWKQLEEKRDRLALEIKKARQSEKRIVMVRRGDTARMLANRYGVSLSVLCRHNRLFGRSPQLRPGQRLVIPGAGKDSKLASWESELKLMTEKLDERAKARDSTSTDPPPADPAPPTLYKVRDQDTLASIAEKHRVTEEAIVKANQLPKPEVAVGQELRIPFVEENAPTKAEGQSTEIQDALFPKTEDGRVYVKKNGTLEGFVKERKLSMDEVLKLNPKLNKYSKIYRGDAIRLKPVKSN